MKPAVLLALGLAALILLETRSLAAEPSAKCAPPFFGPGAGEGLNDSKTIPPTVGAARIGMLFVDFPDTPGSPDPASIYDAWRPAVVDRFRTVSYGRLRIDIVPLLRWIRLPRTLSDYEASRFEGAVEAAVAAADPQFDFGSLDALMLVTATSGSFRLAATVLEHDPIRIDGRALYAWTWISVDASALADRARVLIHETGHLLGLPDLYVLGVASSYHRWDVMTAAPAGGGMFGWHRWKLGWLERSQVACLSRRGTLTTTLTPLEAPGGRKIAVVRFPRSAVVAEVRQPLADDSGICRAASSSTASSSRFSFRAGRSPSHRPGRTTGRGCKAAVRLTTRLLASAGGSGRRCAWARSR